MAAALEVGAPPDVTRANEEDLTKWGADGHLLDVTADRQRDEGSQGGINEGSLPLATMNGQILGAPMGIAANAAHVRADKFREAGYDGLPQTWEEFIEVSKKVTQAAVLRLWHGARPGAVRQPWRRHVGRLGLWRLA